MPAPSACVVPEVWRDEVWVAALQGQAVPPDLGGGRNCHQTNTYFVATSCHPRYSQGELPAGSEQWSRALSPKGQVSLIPTLPPAAVWLLMPAAPLCASLSLCTSDSRIPPKSNAHD